MLIIRYRHDAYYGNRHVFTSLTGLSTASTDPNSVLTSKSYDSIGRISQTVVASTRQTNVTYQEPACTVNSSGACTVTAPMPVTITTGRRLLSRTPGFRPATRFASVACARSIMWDDIGGQNGKRGLCDTIYGLPNPWPICPRLPAAVSAVLAALHLRDPVTEGLRSLDDRQWRDALAFCDSSRLTLYPRDTLREFMPQWVRKRTDANAARNVQRLRKLEQIHSTVSQRLASADIEFVVLKGITHGSLFGGRPENRMQYGIDLYSSHEGVEASRDVLLALGYEPVEGMEGSLTDHLAAMVPKTAGEWRGDSFDLGIPTPNEPHFQFWNERTERLEAPATHDFWNRRTRRPMAGLELAVLCPADRLAYAALHVLKHLLRDSAHPSHVFEIASILDAHTGDDAFWSRWTSLHAPKLRRMEAVVFRLACEWFGCRSSPVPAAEIEQLPATTQASFAAFATSPARSVFDSNEDELWLHWTLLDSRRDSWSIARRRLLPGTLPLRPGNNDFPETKRTWSQWLRPSAEYVSYLLSRIVNHLLALPRTVASGARWWWCMHGTLPPERAQRSEEE